MSAIEKLKIAVFNTQPPHIYHGGVERRIIEIGKRLNGIIDTTVYSGTKSGFKRNVIVNGVSVVPCFSTDIFFPIDNWFFNRTVSQMVERIGADVYEAHTASGYCTAAALRKKGLRKPFIQTVHGVLADEYFESFKIGPLTPRMRLAKFFMLHLSKYEKEAAENATLVVTISKYSLKKMVQLYQIREEKIRIVPNGVDAQRFKPQQITKEEIKQIKSRMGLRMDEKCILFVGNLIPRKGLYLLIDAMKHVSTEVKNVRAVIVGSGPLKNNLIRYAKLNNVLKYFNFLGCIEDEMLPKIYNCCDIVVLPSLQEGQGITLLEAQAVAKPVVACKVGGIPEIVLHEKTGFLVKPDELELSEAILKLLGDENLRGKMGENGRKFVQKNLTWEKCAEKMLNVYREALNLTK
ncbi:MAG: glycosyltransferase family 4 protein [Candidatus Bathyarchaeota archaeon]|nr:glycosyltransferase family 4 protein [Candidatus Bathyarchaeota archaeon]